MIRHANEMDAVAYWRNFEIKMAWDKPNQEVLGTVEALTETRNKVTDPWTPRLAIRRQEDGVLVIIDAYQQRLLAELVLAKPVVGETIWIKYLGEDERAAPGKNPVKRFKVKIDRDSSQPPGGTSGSGEVSGENTPEAET